MAGLTGAGRATHDAQVELVGHNGACTAVSSARRLLLVEAGNVALQGDSTKAVEDGILGHPMLKRRAEQEGPLERPLWNNIVAIGDAIVVAQFWALTLYIVCERYIADSWLAVRVLQVVVSGSALCNLLWTYQIHPDPQFS